MIVMSIEKKQRSQDPNSENTTSKPDAGTLHSTDPQENMEGPVSSTMRQTGEQFDTDESKQEADRERNRKM